MDLVAAFKTLAVSPGTDAASAPPGRRQQAMTAIWERLQQLAPGALKRRGATDDEMDEAAMIVWERLAKGRSRPRSEDPPTETRVDAYLKKALFNNFISLRRKQARICSREVEKEKQRSFLEARESKEREILDGLALVRERALPALEGWLRRDAAARIRRSFEEMEALLVGEETPERATRSEYRDDDGGDSLDLARDRLFTRHCRARKYLVKVIRGLEDETRVDEEQAELMREAVKALRRRHPKGDGPGGESSRGLGSGEDGG